MNKKAILFFLLFFSVLIVAQEDSESNEEGAVAFEPKKTNEIDPDVHLFGIPLRSSEEVATAIYGKPNIRIQFSDKLSGLMYQWNWVFFFEQDQLCGVSFSDGALDYRLMRFVKNYKSPWSGDQMLWYLSNGIHHKMKKKEADQIFKKMAGEKVDNYSAFYKTKLCCVEVNFVGSSGNDKKNEAGEAFGITVMRKGPYEEFNRYGN